MKCSAVTRWSIPRRCQHNEEYRAFTQTCVFIDVGFKTFMICKNSHESQFAYFQIIKTYICKEIYATCITHYIIQRSLYNDSLWAGRSGDRMPVEARFSTPVQTRPGNHPASCRTGNGSSSPGVKRPERGVNYPPHLTPRLKKEQIDTSTPLGLQGLLFLYSTQYSEVIHVSQRGIRTYLMWLSYSNLFIHIIYIVQGGSNMSGTICV